MAMVGIDASIRGALAVHVGQIPHHRERSSGRQPPAQVFDYQGLRVTPNVYTTLQEIDTFVDAMQVALKNGVRQTSAG